MRTLVHLLLLAALGYSRTQGQVISEPDDVTVCEGREAVFTCVLNGNISDDVKWYRSIKDMGTTEMLDLGKENFNFTIDPEENDDENATNSSLVLTITDVIKSYTGYFWVRTPSLNVCNASLTVLTKPSALARITVANDNATLSRVLQWDPVDAFPGNNYTVTWTSKTDLTQSVATTMETSYTVTGLTLDTAYTVTVTAANRCGQGPESSATISFSTIISEPDDVTVCEEKEAVFTCVLNSNIRSDDVQWYRFIKDTSTTVMVDPDGDNINFITDTNGNTTSSSLTITNVIKSYTGYFWVGTPSLNVCNASLTVLTRPPALKVNIMTNIKSSSIVVQWNKVEDLHNTFYTVIWLNRSVQLGTKKPSSNQASYTITGLTLNTVYTIIAFAQNNCGSGPKFTTSIALSTTTTLTSSSISPTVTATNPMVTMSDNATIMNLYTKSASSINPSTTSTNSMNPSTTSTNSINPSTTSTNSMNPSTTSTNSINPVTTSTNSMNPSTTSTNSINTSTTSTNSMNPSITSTNSMNPSTISTNPMNPSTTSTNTMITTSIGTVINNISTTTTAVSNPIIIITTDTLLLSTISAQTTMADTNSESSNIPMIAAAAIGGFIVITVVIVLILVIIFCCLQQRIDTEKNNYNDLSGDDTLTKDIPVALNPLNADKPEAESSHQILTTTEVLYMNSEIGNKKPPPYKPTESTPQNGMKDTQHQQFMEYAEINIDNKKIEDKQQNGGAGTQHQQPMVYAVVDKSKKKNRKGEKQQNVKADDEAVSSSIDHTNANQNKINPALHYADLEVLPPTTGAFVTTDESRTPYALVAET